MQRPNHCPIAANSCNCEPESIPLDINTSRENPILTWVCSLGLAFLIAYAISPPASTLLLLADQLGGWTSDIGMPAVLALQLAAFALSLIWLSRMRSMNQRIGNGLKTAGILLLLPLPMMILFVALQAAQETGAEQGSATAAFFMLMIFGGAYGVLGLGLLIGGIVTARRDGP